MKQFSVRLGFARSSGRYVRRMSCPAARILSPDLIYHVGSRAVDRRQIFCGLVPRDTETFVGLICENGRTVQVAVVCVLRDAQSLPSAPRHATLESLRRHAVAEVRVCALVQSEGRARRCVVGASLLGSRRRRRSRPCVDRAVCDPESGSRRTECSPEAWDASSDWHRGRPSSSLVSACRGAARALRRWSVSAHPVRRTRG